MTDIDDRLRDAASRWQRAIDADATPTRTRSHVTPTGRRRLGLVVAAVAVIALGVGVPIVWTVARNDVQAQHGGASATADSHKHPAVISSPSVRSTPHASNALPPSNRACPTSELEVVSTRGYSPMTQELLDTFAVRHLGSGSCYVAGYPTLRLYRGRTVEPFNYVDRGAYFSAPEDPTPTPVHRVTIGAGHDAVFRIATGSATGGCPGMRGPRVTGMRVWLGGVNGAHELAVHAEPDFAPCAQAADSMGPDTTVDVSVLGEPPS